MNRRNRTLIVLLVATTLASAAISWFTARSREFPSARCQVASVSFAVAAENLPTGTRLTRDHIKMVGWPKSDPVVGGFESPDALVGRGLIQPVNTNEPLTETKLAPVEAGAGLPPSIPPGMRALAVRVNDVISVAGYTVPGTRVDVLVTLSRGEQSLSRAVVSNVQVLTAGTFRDSEQAKDGKPISSTVVTLMVTPDDAERIVLAQNLGSIMLVLRNPLDVVPTDTRGVRLTGLMGQPDAPPVVKEANGARRVVAQKPKPEPPLPQVSPAYTVETLQGRQRRAKRLPSLKRVPSNDVQPRDRRREVRGAGLRADDRGRRRRLTCADHGRPAAGSACADGAADACGSGRPGPSAQVEYREWR